MLLQRSRTAARLRVIPAALVCLLVTAFLGAAPARGDCPDETAAQVYTGGGGTPCPCFITGEEAGTVFNPPAEHYPIQVLRVGLLWASQFGGSPQSLEEAIRIYAGGLPNPGVHVAELLGPLLTDGFINEFDLEAQLNPDIIIESGPVTATLQFLNENAGDFFAPSVCYDSGCHAADNVVFANPGGWSSACALGVPGDWIFYLVYKPCAGSVGVGDEIAISHKPVMLFPPRPNPIRQSGTFEFFLAEAGHASIQVFDVAGRPVGTVTDAAYGPGASRATWTPDAELPGGMYFVELVANGERASAKILLER